MKVKRWIIIDSFRGGVLISPNFFYSLEQCKNSYDSFEGRFFRHLEFDLDTGHITDVTGEV